MHRKLGAGRVEGLLAHTTTSDLNILSKRQCHYSAWPTAANPTFNKDCSRLCGEHKASAARANPITGIADMADIAGIAGIAGNELFKNCGLLPRFCDSIISPTQIRENFGHSSAWGEHMHIVISVLGVTVPGV